MRHLYLFLSLLLCTCVRAQNLPPNPNGKAITVADMQDWNRIRNEQIGADGKNVLYTLTKDVGDPTAIVHNLMRGTERRFPRLHQAKLSYDGRHLIGLLKPSYADTRELKLKEKKKAKEKLAKMDSLLVWDLSQANPVIIPGVTGFKLGERTATSYAYTTESVLPDSLRKDLDKKAQRLVIRNFTDRDSFYLEGVMTYTIARDEPVILAQRTQKDSTWQSGIHRIDTRELRWKPILEGKLDFTGLALSQNGKQASFLTADPEDKDQQKPYTLQYWTEGMEESAEIDYHGARTAIEGYSVSKDYTPRFSDNGRNLFFGTRPRQPEKDTTLLDTEVADVEVWRTEDPRVYPQQNVRLNDEKKRTYLAVYRTEDSDVMQIADEDFPSVTLPRHLDGDIIYTYDERPYAKQTTWEGFPGRRDFRFVNLNTGERSATGRGQVMPAFWLPDHRYMVWYNQTDTTWNSLDATTGKAQVLTNNALGIFYDELNDRPMHPRSYRYAGNLKGGGKLLITDRYDIWEVSAAGASAPRRITRGREKMVRYTLRDLDPENDFLDPDQPQLVTTFYQDTYESGYGWLNLKTGEVEEVKSGPKSFGSFRKARLADAFLFTESDFRQFPDLRFTKKIDGSGKRISEANPQQADFRWGTAENYEWVDNQGRTLKGLLIKPDGFDPNKKYPLLVNFYERNSENVHRHRTPVPGRSSINYSHYVSKGYVIFNPDVVYRIGYPGESAYDCVISGVTSLIQEGFIDRKKMGLQGHSWGGYQGAYIVTKTDMFAAVESGAPVVNMFSAYGGIRWGSGISRQFQYEHTQSRIGGSPWEVPLRYIENSPIFTTDKINTPLLILHNDADGAVPWYQGIEWFMALRRLGKPAWMLNYRGEPHWPVKTPNRADFQTRMAQFFDFYLLDQPMPVWMRDGVAPIKRGKEQGLELLETRR